MLLNFRQGQKSNKIVWARVPGSWLEESSSSEGRPSTVEIEELETDESSAGTISLAHEELWKNWKPTSTVSSGNDGELGATLQKRRAPVTRAPRRVARDGRLYSRQQFLKWYGGVGLAYAQMKWEVAAIHGQVC